MGESSSRSLTSTAYYENQKTRKESASLGRPLMLYLVLNSAGLLLDIIGVVLLFKFGLPEDISRTGTGFLITHQDEDEVKRAKLYDRLGMLGLALLIAGFALQLASNLLQLGRLP
jgi:hypothetical protein